MSFLIQKRKAKWNDFEAWYANWQNAAKENHVMRWGMQARNRIVKEEDLIRLSQATVSVYGDRLQELELTLSVTPATTPDEILQHLEELLPGISKRESGWVEIRRKWVDEQLPEYELVDAMKELYRNAAGLVSRAHSASGVGACLESKFKRPCITNDLE